MAKDDVLSRVRAEFELWGVKFDHEETNGGHIKIRWQVSPDKEPRQTSIPKTSSDWRGPQNAVSLVRRTFMQDGLSLTKPPEKKVSVLEKALSLPVMAEPPKVDPIRAMRGEIGELTDLVLDLVSMVTTLKNELAARPVAQAAIAAPPVAPVIEPEPVAEVIALPVKAKKTRRLNAISYLSNTWNTLEALAKDMQMPQSQAYSKLYYLKSKGLVEQQGQRWRKVRPLTVVNGTRRSGVGLHA